MQGIKSTLHPNVHVFVVENRVFTSPNSSRIAPVPNPQEYRINQNSEPRSTGKLRWLSEAYPYLAYIPTDLRFEGRILQRLCYESHQYPVRKVGSSWVLRTDVVLKWESLERNLSTIASRLLSFSNRYFPLTFTIFPPPHSFGYKRAHRSLHAARKSAEASRDAFVPLMALCSFAISLFPRNLHTGYPAWAELLVMDLGCDATWIEDLRQSRIASFTSPKDVHIRNRVGAFLYPDDKICQWLDYVPVFIRAGVPVWFYWGTRDSVQIPRYLADGYSPCRQDVDDLLKPNPEIPQTPTPGEDQPSETRYPEPEMGSRQRRGQSWQDFYAQEGLREARLLATETPLKRQRRIQLETIAKQQACPDIEGKSAVVYRWVDVEGFLVRQKIDKTQVPDFWDDYGASQRRYSWVFNEWDLCREFDTAAIPDYVLNEEYYNEGDDGYPEAEETQVVVPHLTIETFPAQSGTVRVRDINDARKHEVKESTQQDVHQGYGLEGGEIHSPLANQDFLDHLYQFFGFQDPGSEYIPSDTPKKAWPEVCKLFAFQAGAIDNNIVKEPIADLAAMLLQRITIPNTIWDLSSTSEYCLRDQQTALTTKAIQILHGGRLLTVYSIELSDTSSASSQSYALIVYDAAVALACLRQALGPRNEDVARYLVGKGVKFQTFIAPSPLDVSNPTVPRRHPEVGLGYRPSSFKAGLHDYQVYVTQLADFLKQPWARAAVMEGGIVWRLAKEYIPEDIVVIGPSELVYEYGTSSKCGDEILWDDGLSEDELDLISGLYRVATDKGDQQAYMSWWPKHSQWRSSQCNLQFWSPAAEEWFQKRLLGISEGRFGPKSGREWKSALSPNRHSYNMYVANSSIASRYISGEVFP